MAPKRKASAEPAESLSPVMMSQEEGAKWLDEKLATMSPLAGARWLGAGSGEGINELMRNHEDMARHLRDHCSTTNAEGHAGEFLRRAMELRAAWDAGDHAVRSGILAALGYGIAAAHVKSDLFHALPVRKGKQAMASQQMRTEKGAEARRAIGKEATERRTNSPGKRRPKIGERQERRLRRGK